MLAGHLEAPARGVLDEALAASFVGHRNAVLGGDRDAFVEAGDEVRDERVVDFKGGNVEFDVRPLRDDACRHSGREGPDTGARVE